MSTFVALIGDVQRSREVADFARHRDQALSSLSRSHRQAGWMDADYAVSAWDEFQGLITRPAALPRVLWDVYKAFRPLDLKLAVGGGRVERLADADRAINQSATGEAFFLARKALELLTERRHGAGRARVAVGWNEVPVEAALNSALRLLDLLVAEITGKQWAVIECYEETPHQGEVAARLGKSESTISRSLAAARYWDIRSSIEDLERFLEICTVQGKTDNMYSETHLWL